MEMAQRDKDHRLRIEIMAGKTPTITGSFPEILKGFSCMRDRGELSFLKKSNLLSKKTTIKDYSV
jgi:hypothetical protein